MIKGLILENFKAFSNRTEVNINDLTIISGTNSSGKSTIIQALLLLKQTLENSDEKIVLDYGGRFVKFSNFNEIVFGRKEKQSFKIGFILENDMDNPLIFANETNHFRSITVETKTEIIIEFISKKENVFIKSIIYKKHYENYGTTEYKFLHDKFTWNLKINCFNHPNENLDDLSIRNLNNEITRMLEKPSYKKEEEYKFNLQKKIDINSIEEKFHKFGFSIQAIPDFGEKLFDDLQNNETILNDFEEDDLEKFFNKLLLYTFLKKINLNTSGLLLNTSHFLIDTRFANVLSRSLSVLIKVFHDTFGYESREIYSFLKGIEYLGPYRVGPERAYINFGNPNEIKPTGENSIQFLWRFRKMQIENKIGIFEKRNIQSLESATQDWLNYLDLTDNFLVSRIKGLVYESKIESQKGSNLYVSLADVGYGFSQLLPVILIGLKSKKNQLIIIEQPELHLHPKLQGKLAEFFLCLIQMGKKVLIETHSEHLINMVRLKIVLDSVNELNKKVIILFVRRKLKQNNGISENNLAGSILETLLIDPFGKIIDWPPDFFPEGIEIHEEILSAILEKHSKEANK